VYIRYGDIAPITVIGRIVSCLCALFGAATIGMLVSVLVDRYQRVYNRKLYMKEETIDFHEYSDDENNDADSRDERSSLKRRASSQIVDPDARAKENAINQINLTEIPQTPDSTNGIDEQSITRNNSRIHFIIGYVDNENQETSHTLVEKISSVVAEKQSSGNNNISLNIISSNSTQEIAPHDVQFQIESDDDDDDDHDESLREITNDCRNAGNVLKTFKRKPSQTNVQLKNSEKNV